MHYKRGDPTGRTVRVSTEPLGDAIRRMGRSAGLQAPLSLTDAQLLEHFVARRDEPSFAALMVRHGPMVLCLCRQMLRDAQEAEDAFQAAFLVLVRNARTIRKRPSLSAWLYGVAYKVAARLRGRAERRRTHMNSLASICPRRSRSVSRSARTCASSFTRKSAGCPTSTGRRSSFVTWKARPTRRRRRSCAGRSAR